LTFAEVRSAIHQAREAGAKRLIIPGEGEPFLDENLFSIIDFATALGMKVKVFTNGHLIDRHMARHLFRTGVFLSVKVHSLDAHTYDRLAGKRNAVGWEEYTRMPLGMETIRIPRNLKYVLEEGYDRARRVPWEESRLEIQSVITPHNIDALAGLARCCKEWYTDFFVETVIWAGKAITRFSELSITKEREGALLRELRKILGWRLGLRQKIRCTFETNPFIDISGNIRHCFGMATKVGNIREIPLVELHRREMAIRVERGLLSAPFSFGNKGFRYCATRRALDVAGDTQ
jgi:MoaA/NifB/PqqE/SkfB family radical SAM enzyme